MRTHFVKITVFFIFFALATAVALPVASPKVSGSWHGDWTSPEGFRYEADMQLTVDKDNNVTGEIHWTLRKSPRSEEQERVGLTGVEHVKGAFAPGARVLRMEGTSLDDPKHILGMDKYRLLLSDDGTRLGGSTSNHGSWPPRWLPTNNEFLRLCRSFHNRKNYLFAGSDAGRERAATIYSLIGTAKLNGLDPEAYLRIVLARIADHPRQSDPGIAALEP